MSRSVSVCPCMRVEIDGKNDYLTKSGYPNRQDDRFRGKNMSENISHYSIMKDKLKTHQLDVANRG